MNLSSALFMFQMLSFILVTLIKFYNILHGKKQQEGQIFPYDIKISFVLFAVTLLLYGIGFTINMYGYDETLYTLLFSFETVLLPLNILFFIIEVIYRLSDTALKTIEAHKSKVNDGSRFFN